MLKGIALASALSLLALLAAGPARAQPGFDAELVSALMSAMTAREKVGQLFLVGFLGAEASADVRRLLSELKVGGVYLSQENCNIVNGPEHDPNDCGFARGGGVDTPAQVAGLVAQLQRQACEATRRNLAGREVCLPLLVAVDHEGDGRPLTRLINGFTPVPSAMAIGATFDPSLAEAVGCIVGRELRAVGVNMLFGPDLDVLDLPRSGGQGDQGIRVFGGHPLWVAEMGSRYVQGLHACSEGRLAAVAKHFPGHGRSNRKVDSEDIPVIVGKTLEELQQVDLVPFAAVAQGTPGQAGVTDAIMTSHLSYAGVPGCTADAPITFSPSCLQSFFSLPQMASWRQAGGLIVADDLGSGAALAYARRKFGDYLHASVMEEALLAGNDLLALAAVWHLRDLPSTIAYLVSRYEGDPLVRQRVDDAVRRVLMVKARLYPGLDPQAVTAMPQGSVGRADDRALMDTLALRAVTFIRPAGLDEFRVRLPAPSVGQRVLFVECWDDPACSPPTRRYPPYWPRGKLAALALEMYPGRVLPENLRSIGFSDLAGALRGQSPQAMEALREADYIVLAYLERDPLEYPASEALKTFLRQVRSLPELRGKQVVVFAFGSPYHLDAGELFNLDLFVALYSKTEHHLRAAIKVLFHDPTVFAEAGRGRLPVDYVVDSYALYRISEQAQADPDQTPQLRLRPDPPRPGEPLSVELATPLLARNGHRVPDGTPVTFTFVLPDGGNQRVQALTKEGVARAEIIVPQAGPVRVTVGSGPLLWTSPPITVGDRGDHPSSTGPGVPDSGRGFPTVPVASGVAALLLAAVGYLLSRRARPGLRPQTTAGPASPVGAPPPHPLPPSELTVDLAGRRVFIKGHELLPPLSREQFDLLAYLYENAGRVCTREEIVRRVWPEADAGGISDQALDSLVHRLRERLRSSGAEQVRIVTLRGLGYRLEA
ncbi:MAG TPA: glycoside hydrolase family 3 N-terminal domain-containing protein [Dehalococcoidia bacterium]|nr:glycoside hydrolase family 3 N-terminal domain-containing protein [Dehalococcoidia bacterium]